MKIRFRDVGLHVVLAVLLLSSTLAASDLEDGAQGVLTSWNVSFDVVAPKFLGSTPAAEASKVRVAERPRLVGTLELLEGGGQVEGTLRMSHGSVGSVTGERDGDRLHLSVGMACGSAYRLRLSESPGLELRGSIQGKGCGSLYGPRSGRRGTGINDMLLARVTATKASQKTQ